MDQSEIFGLCYHSLIGYAIASWEGYKPARHHRIIANALERVERGELKRLMIFMPPRHGKSMLASEFFPAWYLGKHPDHQVIHTTYGQELADGFGRKIRNQLKDPLFGAVFDGVGLSGDSSAAARFHVSRAGMNGQDGVYHAMGIGGSATGRGANLLLIDDPVKDREEAESELQREKVKDWYRSVAYTRLMPNGAIVVIQTRWHTDDLAGWLLEEHKHENWEVINMPALNEHEEALWPESYPVERLMQIRETVGPRDWEALYQQRPRAVSGAEFKRHWIQHYTSKPMPHEMSVVILVDPASGKRESNDFTSMWVIGLGQDQNYYVLDIIRDRMNLTERSECLFRLHRKWKPIEVRYERYGMMADVEYIRQEMDRKSYRFVIREVGGATAKVDRIRRLIPLFEMNRVWMPHQLFYTDIAGKEHELIEEFIEQEYLAFPVGRHDDMIDALARIAEPKLDTPWPRQQEFTQQVPAFNAFDQVAGY
jgi:predicted phage terminase large subunit-like protein